MVSEPLEETMNDARLFDLVRYQRGELFEADLITEEEYSWLLSESPLAKGSGSPSPRRLESYDQVRAKITPLETALKEIAKQSISDEMDDHSSEHADWQGGYEALVRIAREALNREKP
jgi:hypothetical protein